MTALLLAAQLATLSTPACPTVQPSPAFVCVNGGWLPPGHPDIPVAAPAPSPLPQPSVPFKIGRRYWRNASGVNPTDIYIAGAGQLQDGAAVLFAVCRSVGDGCYAAGEVRMFPANATAKDWEDRTNWPY